MSLTDVGKETVEISNRGWYVASPRSCTRFD